MGTNQWESAAVSFSSRPTYAVLGSRRIKSPKYNDDGDAYDGWPPMQTSVSTPLRMRSTSAGRVAAASPAPINDDAVLTTVRPILANAVLIESTSSCARGDR